MNEIQPLDQELSSAPPTDLDRLKETWPSLSAEERRDALRTLSRRESEELFLDLASASQRELLEGMTPAKRRNWLRLLPPDDIADLIQEFPVEDREKLLALLDFDVRKDVMALLAYAEDVAGGLMNPRFIRIRPDVPADVAIRYLRVQAKSEIEHVYYAYVLDSDQRLLGTVSFRDLLLAPADRMVADIMKKELITLPEHMDQEEVSREFAKHGLPALPVVDDDGKMKGIITSDDVVEVVEEEATEDIQKLGGMQALDLPYWNTKFSTMIRKRAGWLTVLFIGEMFTATAMSHYEKQIEQAVVLALFIPLIISSGGNSGSQASTLVIRALALQEIRMRDWWRVLMREIGSGLVLGGFLGIIALFRILFWPNRETLYGAHYTAIGIAVACSILGVVFWGATAGAMLPFALRRLGLDPANASAPFVATLVDVTGLIIYFSVANLLLGGVLL